MAAVVARVLCSRRMALAISPQTLVKRCEEIWGCAPRAANGDMAETRYADVVSGRFSAVPAVNAIE